MDRLKAALITLFATILILAIPIDDASSFEDSNFRVMENPIVQPVGQNYSIVNQYSRVTGKPAIAFDGTNFLLVYCKDKIEVIENSCTSIYAMRLSPTGVILDPAGIVVTTGGYDQVGTPSVQFDGKNFLIVWVGTVTDNGQQVNEIYGARINEEGNLLDPNGIKLTTGADSKIARVIGLAFDGTNYMVTWRTNDDSIFVARISKQMVNLDAPGYIEMPWVGHYPAIAFDGTNYLVTFQGPNGIDLDIFGVRVSKDGQILDAEPFCIGGGTFDQQHDSMGFDGVNYWVTWFDSNLYETATIGRVYAARVSPDGEVLDSPALLIAEQARGQWAPQLACDGTGCLVVFNIESLFNNRIDDVHAKRLTQDGQVLDAKAIPVSTALWHQFAPVVGYGAGNYLVAWNELQYSRVRFSIWGQILGSVPPATKTLSIKIPNSAEEKSEINETPQWIAQAIPVTQYATDGFAFNASDIHLIDFQQHIFQDNSGWHTETIPSDHNFAALGKARDNIWVGGWCFASSHFDGTTWTFVDCMGGGTGGYQSTGFWYADDDHLWGSGDKGSVFLIDPTNSLQSSSVIQPAITPYDLEDIAGTGPANGYAVGERGTVLHYDGIQWSQVPSAAVPSIQTLNAIWADSPTDIFVVGDWGTILHYDGSSWIEQTSGTTWHLYDVWGQDENNVYAVGLHGTILHYNGNNWQVEESGTTQDLLTVFGVLDPANRSLYIWAGGAGTQLLSKIFPLEVNFLPMIAK